MSISDAQYAAWLRSSGQRRCVLVEAKVYTGASETTRYISNLGYVTQPGDTPANTHYAEILTAAPVVSAGIDQAMSIGELVLHNPRGALDAWLDDGWDGRDILLFLGDPEWGRDDFRPYFAGIIDHITAPTIDTLALSLRDKRERLNAPVQTALYADGPNEGKEKPLAYGYILNAEPVLESVPDSVSVSSLTSSGSTATASATAHGYAVSDRVTIRGASPDAYNGDFTVATVPDADTFTYTLNVGSATSPATGTIYARETDATYRLHADGEIHVIGAVYDNGDPTAWIDLSGGFVLPSSPVGRITCSFEGAEDGGGSLIYQPGSIAQVIATREGLLDIAEIDTDSIADIDAAAADSIGLYLAERRNAGDVIDQIMATVGGYWYFTRAGLLRLWRLEEPAGTPVLELTADDLTGRDIHIVRREPPVRSVRLGRHKNWTIQDPDSLATSLSDEQRTALSSPYLAAPDQAENTGIEVEFKGALTPDIQDTLYSYSTTEGARRAALRDHWRSVFQITCNLSALACNLGDVVQLTYPRFGFDSGALAIVVGMDENIGNDTVVLRLWR